jgi:uncharacterized RDD family membrane protein YckC
MNCRYCGAANAEEEHRCVHCGRRLGGFAASPLRGSTVPKPAREAPLLIAMPNREAPLSQAPRQQSLFRVIPFESIAPPREEGPPARQRSPVARDRAPAPKRTRRAPHPNQQSLEFAAPETQPSAPPETAAEPAVQCDAPVASIRARSAAVALDLAFVLLGFGVMLGILRGRAGELPLDRTAALIYGAAFALLLFFYKVLACVRAGHSPGARMMGLRLLHFDGRPADRRQRLLRLASGCLSLLPLGVGFLWALVDEERLTFHDHITQTFTTPAESAR